MFTGIVDHCGVITEIKPISNDSSTRLWIRSCFDEFQLGESIAVDGMCLTVIDQQQHDFACELSQESMRVGLPQYYQNQQRVNLERAMRFSDRVGGHFVTGHVDHLAVVAAIVPHEQFHEITFQGIDNKMLDKQLLAQKGSVAINGVSLTINVITDNQLSVMLIPHTLEKTNLSDLSVGAKVNIEYDYLAKLVAHQMQRSNDDD